MGVKVHFNIFDGADSFYAKINVHHNTSFFHMNRLLIFITKNMFLNKTGA